ncbi:MAG: response regulator [Acidobacteria bacterium]|jgi:response regulator RpfG family c-di-GMP phosphodiesterase|nr:response regulator [Acidobacteriota bacterium]
MSERILLVDDEPSILQGYQRLLRNEFELETASSGEEALKTLSHHGPFAVVVSDMRMPGMDGIQFLAKVKRKEPETIRIMLTGHADIETAVHAVNEGSIFRFLTKPCNKEVIAKTLTAALVQYRLVTAEKELLEKTLSGSIHVLTEVLGLVNPAAFSRSVRLRRYVRHVAEALQFKNLWRFEVAAMLSQLGCVTLHPDTIDAVYAGERLRPEEQARYDAHPSVANDLLRSIPRMEPIAWMIGHQNKPLAIGMRAPDPETAHTMHVGAQILHIALAFDELLRRGIEKDEAIRELERLNPGLDARILPAMRTLEPEEEEAEARTCPIEELATGMVLNQEVRTQGGLLIVAKGQEVTYPLILKLKNFHEKGAIEGSVGVLMAKNPTT